MNGATRNEGLECLRNPGRIMEQLGFAVGCKLQITARNGELVVTVVEC
ncbi:hypothetical protein BI312_07365 [Xanthomonas citri pv. citri]|nr:hypothetical protein BI314_07500 [Xanthomonas citri pv. citri]QYF46170.1 type I addiction module toxin, SymE family [Xanthomonas citri]APR14711.1 hypothetical protein BI315_07395 [Xanthomonas citri pv. citri]APR21262.1 hypothetical protein BI316_18780 [Xanthomonas citri pv. citri]APR26513.1 hypothetical protein BJD09_22490 [Xanthomonas citri pv. citri]